MRTYIFIDLETSGLDPNLDRIVEIGWMYADAKLKRITDTQYTAVKPVGFAIDRILSNETVRAMHDKTGLLTALTNGDELPLLQNVERDIVSDLDEIEERYQLWLPNLSEEERMHPSITQHMEFVLAGKNVHFDKAFIDRYMPLLSKRLSYRTFDESSLRFALEAVGVGLSIKAGDFKATHGGEPVEGVILGPHRAGYDVELSYTVMQFAVREMAERSMRPDGVPFLDTFMYDGEGNFTYLDPSEELDADLKALNGESD